MIWRIQKQPLIYLWYTPIMKLAAEFMKKNSKYQTVLPSKEELKKLLEEQNNELG